MIEGCVIAGVASTTSLASCWYAATTSAEVAPFHVPSVIVSTLPGQSSRWIGGDLPGRVARLTGAPVTHVVANDMRPEPHVGPPPDHEKSPLGPLGVLAWGGARR